MCFVPFKVFSLLFKSFTGGWDKSYRTVLQSFQQNVGLLLSGQKTLLETAERKKKAAERINLCSQLLLHLKVGVKTRNTQFAIDTRRGADESRCVMIDQRVK